MLLHVLLADSASPAAINISLPSQIASAAASALPGDEIVLADGVYSSPGTIHFTANGTLGAQITLRSATPGGVVLTGVTNLVLSGSWLVLSGFRFDGARHTTAVVSLSAADDSRVTQCAFVNSGSTKSVFDRMLRIENGSDRTRVDHCFFQGNLATGVEYIYVAGNEAGSDHLFDYNYLRDIQRVTTNGRETIKIGSSQKTFGDRDTRVVVQHNLWYKTEGDNELISVKASNNTVRFNTFSDSLRECGLQIRGGSNNVVEGNYLYRTAEGLKLMGENGVVFNNYLEDTIRSSAGSAQTAAINLEAGTSNSPSADVQAAQRFLVAYNTVVRTRDYLPTRLSAGIALGARKNFNVGNPLDYRDANPTDNAFANNILTSDQGILISDTASTRTTYLSNYVFATGNASYGVKGTGLTQTDPGLIDDGTVFRLTSSSAARDAASFAGWQESIDIEGQARDASPDVGADEYSVASSVRGPLTASLVGPAWMGGPTSNLDLVPHVAPRDLVAFTASPRAVYLDWIDQSSDEEGFEIRYRPSSSYWRVLSVTAAANTPFIAIPELSANTHYSFQVRAIGSKEASAWSAPADVTTYDAYLESGGDLTIEAEHPSVLFDGSTPYTAWIEGNSENYAGFVGRYLEASSQTGTPAWADAPGMDYRLRFSTAGTYTVWIRVWGDSSATDSLHWGYNGTMISTFVATIYGSWIWRKLGTVTVASGDVGELNLRRRERNLRIDRIYLTTSSTNPMTLGGGQGPTKSDAGFLPAITSMTKTDVINEGAGFTFMVSATGNPAPTFQWKKDGNDIFGATSSSYKITAAGASDQAEYSVVLTNSAGSVTSPAVDLAVRPAPVFTTQPSGGSYDFGSTIALTFAATPSWDRTIQWRKNGTNITGATGTTYQIVQASMADAGNYSVRLTNPAGNATSADAIITISTSNPGTAQHWMENGGCATLESEKYDSLFAGTGYAAWSNGSNSSYPGFIGSYMEASSDLGTPSWADAPGMNYHVSFATIGTYHVWIRLWADGGSTDSLHWGSNDTFMGTFGASVYGSWIWRKLGTISVSSIGVNSINLRGRERNLRVDRIYLTTTATNPSTINSGDGPTASSRSGPLPTLTAHPAGTAVPSGSRVTLTCAATNAASYQWYVYTMAGSTGPVILTPVAGATSASYTMPNVNSADTGVYLVKATNAFGSATSAAAPVILNQPLGGSPSSRSAATGSSTLFSVAPDEPVSLVGMSTFQWKKDGMAISGATGASLLVSNLAATDEGDYTVTITMGGVTFETSPATLTVF